jgi:hypothetical protein
MVNEHEELTNPGDVAFTEWKCIMAPWGVFGSAIASDDGLVIWYVTGPNRAFIRLTEPRCYKLTCAQEVAEALNRIYAIDSIRLMS